MLAAMRQVSALTTFTIGIAVRAAREHPGSRFPPSIIIVTGRRKGAHIPRLTLKGLAMKLLGVAVVVSAVLLAPLAFVQSAVAQMTKPAPTAPKQNRHPQSVDDWPDYKPPPAATKQEEDPWANAPEWKPSVSRGELDELRAKLISLWNPPAGVSAHPDQYVVTIRIKLSGDHRLVGQPEVLTKGDGSLFEATRDSAVRAVLEGQPYDMLSLTTYDQWKEIDINFDPREVVGAPKQKGDPWEDAGFSNEPHVQALADDRAFYTEYLPSMSGLTADFSRSWQECRPEPRQPR